MKSFKELGVKKEFVLALPDEDNVSLEIKKEIHFPHSLGLLYSAFTYYTGFKVNSGEYKVMGLAPYGEPKYAKLIKDHLIDIKEDGSFALDISYFNYCTGLTMTNEKFDKLFGGPRRSEETMLTQREMDLAASIQAVTEEVVIRMATFAREITKKKNLEYALKVLSSNKLNNITIYFSLWYIRTHSTCC